jgi:hypothetical protein
MRDQGMGEYVELREHERQIERARLALASIAAYESGSRGAYSKFIDCQDIAKRCLDALNKGETHGS